MLLVWHRAHARGVPDAAWTLGSAVVLRERRAALAHGYLPLHEQVMQATDCLEAHAAGHGCALLRRLGGGWEARGGCAACMLRPLEALLSQVATCEAA
jgi:hypothetical protein